MFNVSEQIFEPFVEAFLNIVKRSDDAEPAPLMANTRYGLTIGVYTLDKACAEAILRQLKTGTVS